MTERTTSSARPLRRELALVVVATVVLLALHLWLTWNQRHPGAGSDQFGYLGSARWLSGDSRTYLLPNFPYYPLGYPLVLTPAFWVFREAEDLFRSVVVLNAVLASGLFPLLYGFGRVLLQAGRAVAGAAAMVGALVPAVTTYGAYALAENLVFPLVVATVLACWLMLSPRPSWQRVLFAPAMVLLYMTHERFTPMVPVAILVVLASSRLGLTSARIATANVGGILALGFLASRLKNAVVAARWVRGIDRPQGTLLYEIRQNFLEPVIRFASRPTSVLLVILGTVAVALLARHLRRSSPLAGAGRRARVAEWRGRGPSPPPPPPGAGPRRGRRRRRARPRAGGGLPSRPRGRRPSLVRGGGDPRPRRGGSGVARAPARPGPPGNMVMVRARRTAGRPPPAHVRLPARERRRRLRGVHPLLRRRPAARRPVHLRPAQRLLRPPLGRRRRRLPPGRPAAIPAGQGRPRRRRCDPGARRDPARGPRPRGLGSILDEAGLDGVYQRLSVPAVALFIPPRLADGGPVPQTAASLVPWATAAAVLTMAAIAIVSRVGRSRLGATAACVALATAWFVATGADDLRPSRPYRDWPAVIDDLGVDEAALHLERGTGVPVNYQWYLPGLRARPWNLTARPGVPYVFASLGSRRLARAGGQVGYLDDVRAFPSSIIALWVLPGREQDRLNEEERLLPAGFPAALPTSVGQVDLALAGAADRAAVRATSGGSARLSIEGRHDGSGSPWPDKASFSRQGRMQLRGRPQSPGADRRPQPAEAEAELPSWIQPGQSFRTTMVVRAVDDRGTPLPPGRHRFGIDVHQVGYRWFVPRGGEALDVVLEVTP